MPFLDGDLQSIQNANYVGLLGALLQNVAHINKLEASTSPKELLQQISAVATGLCSAPINAKAGAAFDARLLIIAHMKD